MTDDKRLIVAEQLLQVIFSLREDDSQASQAWVLSIATTAMARAVLASVGPTGDATEILGLAQAQLTAQVQSIQSEFMRKRLTIARS